MAEEVKFSKLKAYLQGLPKNTPDTPYEINVVGYKKDSPEDLKKVLEKCDRYVDLSCTTLDGISNLDNGFSDCRMLVGAPNFTNCTSEKADSLFDWCTYLKQVNTSGFTNVTDASSMFCSCESLTSIDTSAFTNITDASSMFRLCVSFTKIDTSAFTNVTNAKSMFSECTGLTSIDTSAFTNVINANAMFHGCAGLTNIDTKVFTNVTDAGSMFSGCVGLTNIDTKVFTNVTKASRMFYGCVGLTNIDTKVFTNVTDAGSMFSGCVGLTNIDTKVFTNVTKASRMFYGCVGLTSIDTSVFINVKDAGEMFCGCLGLTSINLTPFEDVGNANKMFAGCNNLDEESKKATETFMQRFGSYGKLNAFNNIVLELKQNLVFRLSLSSKELFHSNMIATFLENAVIKPSYLGLDNDKHKVFTTFREKSNLDLIVAYCNECDFDAIENTLYNTGDSFDVTQKAKELSKAELEELVNKLRFIIVENKFKSIPYFEQLDKYNKDIEKGIGLGCNIKITPNNSTCYVLAPQYTLDSTKEDIEKAGWKTASYDYLAGVVEYTPNGVTNIRKKNSDAINYSLFIQDDSENNMINAYTEMLRLCLQLSDQAMRNSNDLNCVAFVSGTDKECLKRIRMHDMYEKLWFANSLKLLPHAGQKNVTVCRTNYYHQNGLWEWKLKAPESVGLKNNLYFGIQIQARKFMISFEPEGVYRSKDEASRNEKILKWINSILSELKTEYPNDFTEKSGNKKDKLNQYGDFKYSYLKMINGELTFAALNAMIESAIDKINKSFETSDFAKDFNDSCFETKEIN